MVVPIPLTAGSWPMVALVVVVVVAMVDDVAAVDVGRVPDPAGTVLARGAALLGRWLLVVAGVVCCLVRVRVSSRAISAKL